jgi:hypothetical protein
MKTVSVLRSEHHFAIKKAQDMGFLLMNQDKVREHLATATRLMEEAGYVVSHSSSAISPKVMVASSDQAFSYLKDKEARGVYGFGVALVKSVDDTEVIVHELVHHLQGIWTEDIPKDSTIPYHERWEEIQAHHIGFAVRMHRSPRSLLVKLRLRIAGIKLPLF